MDSIASMIVASWLVIVALLHLPMRVALPSEQKPVFQNLQTVILKKCCTWQPLAASSTIQNSISIINVKYRKGKNKMSVINVVRNKLLHRMVAVVHRGTPYEVSLKNS